MIKLYARAWTNAEDVDLEYEISDELAEFLRIKAWGDYVDEMEEEDKTCNEFEMEISGDDVNDFLSDKDVHEPIVKELSSINADASSVVNELVVKYVLEEYPPEDWDIYGWLRKDLETGLFIPSLSFEQFLEDENWDASDEDFDEEEARGEYFDQIQAEYTEWIDKLPTYDRAERYNLDEFMGYDEVVSGYTLQYVNKAVEE